MKKAVLVGLVLSSVSGSWAQLPALYAAGRTIADQGISLKSWGSGTIGETDEAAFEGTTSIRVTSRNFFQGGSIMLSKPVDLSAASKDKNNLILLALRVPGVGGSSTPGGGTPGGASSTPGGGSMDSPGGRPTGGGGGQQGGGGQNTLGGKPGSGGGGGGSTTSPSDIPPLTMIRLIVSTTDGKKSEVYVPISASNAGAKGWLTLGVPIQAISGFAKTNGIVQSVSISGNTIATMYVGELRVLTDSTPIYGEPNLREMNIGSGTTVDFSASGYGGASILKYAWDFNSSDGIQEDAVGQYVKKRFATPGTYTVTLTISDIFGLKAPYKTTAVITVN